MATTHHISTTGSRNRRRGPGTNYVITGTTRRGVPWMVTSRRTVGGTPWGMIPGISANQWSSLVNNNSVRTSQVGSFSGGGSSFRVQTGGIRLNVREAPGTSFNVISTLADGRNIRATHFTSAFSNVIQFQRVHSWIYIPEFQGWVFGEHVRSA